ncbi:MAG: hypothetical protein K8F91_22225 [Candidatus Obscuribacterales bacterium]|nr:hypothetical protein [Candidatus Obscuribacterales bacterium]
MQPCTKAKLWTYCLRFLAVIVTGLAAWYFSQPIAEYFGRHLSDHWQVGSGVIGSLIALLISNRALDFTEDCMTIPDVVAQAEGPRASCSKEGCHRSGQSSANSDARESGKLCSKEVTGQPFSFGTVVANRNFTAVLEQVQANELTVVVTVSGLTSSQFKGNNGLRHRLESVAGITWENPTNLGNGKRIMKGRFGENGNRDALVAKLKEIGSRYV